MVFDSRKDLPEVRLAAGGIVWREMDNVDKVAVIHRPKYDDWSLPKGKPDPGETLAQTAEREVYEELGCKVDFLNFAGTTHYPIPDGKLKLVLFWHMRAREPIEFRPNREVDQLLWLTPAEALKKLSHEVEIELLSNIMGEDKEQRRQS